RFSAHDLQRRDAGCFGHEVPHLRRQRQLHGYGEGHRQGPRLRQQDLHRHGEQPPAGGDRARQPERERGREHELRPGQLQRRRGERQPLGGGRGLGRRIFAHHLQPGDPGRDHRGFTPDDNGSYVVTFTATDKDGASGSDSKTISATNVAPTATLGNNGPVNEATPATISFSGQFDPSSADTTAGFHYAYSCTNGSL